MRHRLRSILEPLTGAVILVIGLLVTLITPRGPRDRLPGRRHEGSDLNTPGVLAAAAALLLGLAMVVVFSAWLEVRLTGRAVRLTPPPTGTASAPAPSALARQQPRSPAALPLSGAPAQDLAALRAEEARHLSTYGWIDRDAGIVRIPIDRAMELVVARESDTSPAARAPATGRAPR